MTRVVLLGASNLAIGFPVIVRQLFSGLPRPLEIFAACGHGRSFCNWSRVLFRALPGIDRCGLWTDLDRAADARSSRTLALVTDVGNDLIYGSAPDVIARRVETCLAALARPSSGACHHAFAAGQRRTAFGPAVSRHEGGLLPAYARSNGPKCGSKARELDQSLAELGARFSARLIDQPLEWYGFDPLHIRRSRRARAWQTIFSGWPSFGAATQNHRLSLADVVRLRLAAPSERRLFGRHQVRTQPALELGDVAIRLY